MKHTLLSAVALSGLTFAGCATEPVAAPVAPQAPATVEVPVPAPVQPPVTPPPVAPPGGFTPVPTTDESAVAAAMAATTGFEEGWAFKKLVSAQSQVVAGTNYELKIALENAKHEGLISATVWKKLDGTLEVTAREWLEKPEIALPETTLPGGYGRVKPTDPEVQKAARAALAKIGGGWKLGNVVSAHSQVVAGTNYRFTFNAKKGGETKKGVATVWKKLDGTMVVTTWRWEKN